MKLASCTNTIHRTLRFLRTACGVVVPQDFDWEYYLDFYPDLRQAGIRSKADALNHYIQHGFFENRFTGKQDNPLMLKHEIVRLQQLKNIRLFNEQQRRIITNGLHDRTITVSVVITVFNYSTYIDACIKSVLSSTLQDIEIIIVNDCSTDDSLSRCLEYVSCELPITIIDKQANTGVSHSRNLGILQARGAYIFILDVDNEIYPRCLEEHLNTMRSDSSLIACYAVIDMYDESGALCGQNSKQPFDLKKLRNGNYIDTMAMFNRQELISVGAYDEHLLERGIGYEDYDLWLRIGRRNKPVGFIEQPLSRYLQKTESMLSTAIRYYHIPLMSFFNQKYFRDQPSGDTTAVLVLGMHRSGTSALAGLIGLLGADLGPDLIGPDQSNIKGHFEPRKIVTVNDDLLESLGARAPESGDLPEDWLNRNQTKKAKNQIREIIRDDFSARDIFVIKDPRLCLLLPLYRELFEELGIRLKIIVIRRNRHEVIRSLNERDGMPHGIGKNYYKKHVKALEANLAGTKSLPISFDQLIEAPDAVIKQIESFIPQLSGRNNRNDGQPTTAFIDSALRHHRLKPKSRLAPVHSVLSHVRRRLKNGSS
jgi:glycosyltransferase involved in cell wall biosynthesis